MIEPTGAKGESITDPNNTAFPHPCVNEPQVPEALLAENENWEEIRVIKNIVNFSRLIFITELNDFNFI